MTAPEVEGCSRGLIGLQQISGREAAEELKGYSIAEERQSTRLWKSASF
jgi:ribosomal 30S subunit maturation factor RimM